MSYELYWFGDPTLTKAYRTAYKLKIKAENERLWMQGVYNFNAVSTALSNLNFDGKKHKVNKYLEKPFELFPKTEEEKRIEEEKARQKVIDSLNRLKRSWDLKNKKGQ